MKKMNLVSTREDLIKELEELYEKKTRMGMQGLEMFGDDCAPMITIVDVKRNEYEIPLIAPIGSNDIEVKNEIAAKVAKILKKKKGLVFIGVGDGWSTHLNEGEPIPPFLLKSDPKLFEIFYASIDSMVLKKMKIWKIQRNEKGERIFPLGEPAWTDEDYFSKYTGNYFKGC